MDSGDDNNRNYCSFDDVYGYFYDDVSAVFLMFPFNY